MSLLNTLRPHVARIYQAVSIAFICICIPLLILLVFYPRYSEVAAWFWLLLCVPAYAVVPWLWRRFPQLKPFD
jgi:hypothetical protein